MFRILLIFFLSSCSSYSDSDYDPYWRDDGRAILVSKVYSFTLRNQQSQKKEPAKIYIEEVGGEVVIAPNDCSKNSNHYVIGKKIDFTAGSVSMLPINNYLFAINDEALEANYLQQNKENYQHKPLYQISSIPSGKYQICAINKFYFDKDGIFKNKIYKNRQNINFNINAGEVIYLGDWLLEDKEIRKIYNSRIAQEFIDSEYPELSENLRVKEPF